MASFFHANKSVPLPMEFINKYIISANATYVKVYLYGLAKCYEGNEDVSNAQIAEALDILETDVSKAWRYWKKVGLVHSEGQGTLVFDAVGRSQEKDTSPKENTKESSEKENVQKAKPSSMKEISKASRRIKKEKNTRD